MNETPTRRRFLKNGAATAFLAAAPAIVRGQNLNSGIQLAAIGSDGKGWDDTKQMATHDRVKHVAFCDIDLGRMDKVKQLQPQAQVFQDYRDMLGKLGDKIDAVTVSTPDHMHAFIALDAMRQGKHVYVQKPISHTVWEARQMRLQAAKSGVITRMGNQIHSHKFYRTGVRWIQAGTIGKVREVHSWVRATGHGYAGTLERPATVAQAPNTLDWDKWIGTAPFRPFAPDIYHPFKWRDWQDFGSGAVGDFGCHILDPVFTALKIEKPLLTVQADHTGINHEVWPCQSIVYRVFPGTEYTAAEQIRITWYDGLRMPTVKGSHVPNSGELPASGSLIIGEEGTMVLPHVGMPKLYPEEKFKNRDLAMADDQNHYHGWVDGCLTGIQPSDGFEYGGPLTEVVQLGNIAVRFPGKKLEWDATSMKFPNLPEADPFLTKSYREGWEIKAVS